LPQQKVPFSKYVKEKTTWRYKTKSKHYSRFLSLYKH